MFQIKTTVKDVETPLIKSELEAIDVRLSSAETTLFWNSEGTKATFVSPWVQPGGVGGVRPVTQACGCFCQSSHSGLRGLRLCGGPPRRGGRWAPTQGGRWAQGGRQRSRKCAREAEDRLPDLPHPRPASGGWRGRGVRDAGSPGGTNDPPTWGSGSPAPRETPRASFLSIAFRELCTSRRRVFRELSCNSSLSIRFSSY